MRAWCEGSGFDIPALAFDSSHRSLKFGSTPNEIEMSNSNFGSGVAGGEIEEAE